MAAGSPVNDQTNSDATGSYHEIALQIARFSIISQTCNRPLKWRILYQNLQTTNPRLKPSMFLEHLQGAATYLKENFGMDLVQLNRVAIPGNLSSPQRDEYVLVSRLYTRRRLLNLVTPQAQKHESGLMLFILTLIILKSDGVSYSDLRNSVISARLHLFTELDDEVKMLEEVNKWLSRLLKIFLAQRVLETYKRKPPSRAAAIEGAQEEDVTLYCIGPTAPHLVNSRELFEVILRIQFPGQDYGSEEFQKNNEIVIRSLKQKFEGTILGSVP